MIFIVIWTPLETMKKYAIMSKQMPMKRDLFFQKFVAGKIKNEL